MVDREVSPLHFLSNFDSGNLSSVSTVDPLLRQGSDDGDEYSSSAPAFPSGSNHSRSTGSGSSSSSSVPGLSHRLVGGAGSGSSEPTEFFLTVAPDCHGTNDENTHRSWFYFSVTYVGNDLSAPTRGAASQPSVGSSRNGRRITFTIVNFAATNRIFDHDNRPVYRTDRRPAWERLPHPVQISVVDRDGNVSPLPAEMTTPLSAFPPSGGSSSSTGIGLAPALGGAAAAQPFALRRYARKLQSCSMRVSWTHTFTYKHESVHFAMCFPYSYRYQLEAVDAWAAQAKASLQTPVASPAGTTDSSLRTPLFASPPTTPTKANTAAASVVGAGMTPSRLRPGARGSVAASTSTAGGRASTTTTAPTTVTAAGSGVAAVEHRRSTTGVPAPPMAVATPPARGTRRPPSGTATSPAAGVAVPSLPAADQGGGGSTTPRAGGTRGGPTFATAAAAANPSTPTAVPLSPTGRDENHVYFHRETLCFSLQNRRVDLITLTGYNGIALDTLEPEISETVPVRVPNATRPHLFPEKRLVLLTARVHPGETPSSHVIHGCVQFLLSSDPRAVALRRHFVFKIIPMLNPDGVALGHYRTDSRGVNLNRMYDTPDLGAHPAIFAARRLFLSLAATGRMVLYVDLHAHASKRGCFVFGNALEDRSLQLSNMAFPKLLSLNSPHFDFPSCDFTTRSMATKSRADPTSKEGTGRVALAAETGLVHSYTLEVSYNAGGALNAVAPLDLPVERGETAGLGSGVGAGGGSAAFERMRRTGSGIGSPGSGVIGGGALFGFRGDGVASQATTSRYCPETYGDVGRAIVVSLLDYHQLNPVSRLPHTPFVSVGGVKQWLDRQIRQMHTEQVREDAVSDSSYARTLKTKAQRTRSLERVAQQFNLPAMNSFAHVAAAGPNRRATVGA